MARSSGKAIFYLIATGFGLIGQFLARVLRIRLVSGLVVYPSASAPQGRAALEGFAWPINGTPGVYDQ